MKYMTEIKLACPVKNWASGKYQHIALASSAAHIWLSLISWHC